MAMLVSDGKLTVSVTQAGELLGVSRATAYEGVRRGQIPSIRVGRRILIPLVSLERLLAEAGQQDDGASK